MLTSFRSVLNHSWINTIFYVMINGKTINNYCWKVVTQETTFPDASWFLLFLEEGVHRKSGDFGTHLYEHGFDLLWREEPQYQSDRFMNINFYWALIFWNAHFSLAICHRFHRHCQVGGLAISAAPIVHWIGLKCLGFGDMYCMCSFSHVQRRHLRAGDPILFLWLQEITALASQN